MTRLLEHAPYAQRDDDLFLREMIALDRHHRGGCAEYARIWPEATPASTVADLPWLHVGLFKRMDLRTAGDEVEHQRTLLSSSTSGVASRVVLDRRSSELQVQSTTAIFSDYIGTEKRPLVILDSRSSLLRRGELGARVAAALSLRPFATDLRFVMDDPERPDEGIDWDAVAEVAAGGELLVYGFSWVLWLAWGAAKIPDPVREQLRRTRIHFVHSGGWKRLEAQKVERSHFDQALLDSSGPGSQVVDFYGLVEQIGVVYPLCEEGFRHTPAWADAIVRDSWTLEPIVGEAGQLQLLNCLARGAPYHSVLTEDLAVVHPGACPCGRGGTRFEVLGRIPKAETRGCANV